MIPRCRCLGLGHWVWVSYSRSRIILAGVRELEASDLPFDPSVRFPVKVVAQIENLEFVEMANLLQEAWVSDNSESNSQSFEIRARRAPVTDISLCGECFSVMATIITRKYPHRAPELFAYMRRIFHASRTFEGHAWVADDRVYRRQAASRRSLAWSREDQALYNEAFAGRAKQCTRCKHCLSEHHMVDMCTDVPAFPFVLLMVSAPLPMPVPAQPPLCPIPQHPLPRSGEVCRKFNENRCFYRQCRHVHACSMCTGPHPFVMCQRSSRDPYPRRGLPEKTGGSVTHATALP